ncbi:hypothetical protein [Kitasatospora sp. NPDC015120]|uniref:hypothetical protein n=1 Tax=Kitasatospora sp. NPDC015120 TaxID=3364023 RepID=UPI0036F4539F
MASLRELDPVDRVIIADITSLSRAERPHTPVPDDRNPWETGRCWLYCGRDEVAVLWIGPVTVAAATAPMFACARCITRLNSLVWDHLSRKDLGPDTANPAAADPQVIHAVAYSRTPAIAGTRSHRRKPTRAALLGEAVGDRLSRLRLRRNS